MLGVILDSEQRCDESMINDGTIQFILGAPSLRGGIISTYTFTAALKKAVGVTNISIF